MDGLSPIAGKLGTGPLVRRADFSPSPQEIGLPSDMLSLGQSVPAAGPESLGIQTLESGLEAATQPQSDSPALEKQTSNAPTLLLEEPVTAVAAQGPTLAQVMAEATRGGPGLESVDAIGRLNNSSAKRVVKTNRTNLNEPRMAPGEKLSLLQRLGNAFKGFLTSDPVKELRGDLESINTLEVEVGQLTPEQFQAKTVEFKARLAAGETLEQIRTEAYAVARQAAVQALGLRPYDCQILGALAMDDGNIAEMKTGEGKTLTALLPLYLNGLAGKGAHLVTVNDTLASRDADDMGPAFKLLGMSVGTVLEKMTNEQKRAGYACDITYTTDRTLGFDYLHDSLAQSPSQRVQREPFFALIDEVDEVLLDEARTPLVVSGAGEEASADYKIFNEIAKTLVISDDFQVEPKNDAAWLTDTGLMWVENQLVLRDLGLKAESARTPAEKIEIASQVKACQSYGETIRAEQKALRAHFEATKQKPDWWARTVKGAQWEESDDQKIEALEKAHKDAQQARAKAAEAAPTHDLFAADAANRYRYLNAVLKAHAVFAKDKDYLVADDEVQIVDEGKGRTSEGRRYNDGVHQALEAKEGVTIKNEQRTIASITYPNLFKRYARLAGMSGTAKSSEGEFVKLYGLSVIQVPTDKPLIRVDEPDIVFRTLEEKYTALAKDAADDYRAGRPVLIGTLSVEHNVYLARKLREAGVPEEALQVLNAQSVRGDKTLENAMIANAGRSGIVTVATNMAGRGANIKPDLVNFKDMAGEILEALRQGRPVVATVTKKEEAELLGAWLANAAPQIVPADFEGAPAAGQVQIRWTKGVKHPTELSADQGQSFHGDDYPTGGLTVYGTERASSRRIDDQLIGRGGRQGAPGRTKFYLSLEDDLLRVSGKPLAGVLSLFTKPGVGVSSGLIDRMVVEAQQQVEGSHFAARESTHKQDEVQNIQRETYFHFRDSVLLDTGPDLRTQFGDMVGDAVVSSVLAELPDKEKFSMAAIEEATKKAGENLKVPLNLPFLKSAQGPKMTREDLEAELRDHIDRTVKATMAAMDAGMPNTDGVLRSSLLAIIDNGWSEHLEAMETLKLGVTWQVLAEKDPEVEFKLGAFEVFGETVARVKAQAATDVLGAFLAYATVFSKDFQPPKV